MKRIGGRRKEFAWGTNKIWSQMKIIFTKKIGKYFCFEFSPPPPLNWAQQMKMKNKLFQIAQNGEKIYKTYLFSAHKFNNN